MNWDAIDWKALERLRGVFLAATAGTDYWQSESDLTSYDATFAQRIGWKWDYVLAELSHRGWSPPGGALLDWGCGSGIASRAFLDHFGKSSISELHLWDRSSLAMQFAARRAQQKYPGLKVDTGPGSLTTDLPVNEPTPNPSGEGERARVRGRLTLLISHVLTELTPEQTEALADLVTRATSVIWIEPGTYEASRTLIAIRERLCDTFKVVAPCTHQERCGILAPENQRHWCHHFASPPSSVFIDGNWARFANLLGIDLRDLPLSFLVLDQRPAPLLPAGATRVIGHPRIYKAHALLLGCDASGVRERKLTRRVLPEEFRRWKKDKGEVLQVWRCDGDEIAEKSRLDLSTQTNSQAT
jgi:hypothetical protein